MLCTKYWGKAFNTCWVIPWFILYKGVVCIHHVIPPLLGFVFWSKEARFCIDQHMRVLTEVGSITYNSLNDRKFMLKWHAKVYKGPIVSRGAVNDCIHLNLYWNMFDIYWPHLIYTPANTLYWWKFYWPQRSCHSHWKIQNFSCTEN